MWLKLFFQVSRRTRLLVLLTFMGVRIWHWSDSWLLERKQQLFVFFLFFSWKFAFVVRKIQWSFCGIFVCCDFKVTKGMNEAVLKGNTRGRTGVLCPALKEEEQSWTGEWLQKGQEGMPHGCWLGSALMEPRCLTTLIPLVGRRPQLSGDRPAHGPASASPRFPALYLGWKN